MNSMEYLGSNLSKFEVELIKQENEIKKIAKKDKEKRLDSIYKLEKIDGIHIKNDIENDKNGDIGDIYNDDEPEKKPKIRSSLKRNRDKKDGKSNDSKGLLVDFISQNDIKMIIEEEKSYNNRIKNSSKSSVKANLILQRINKE